MGKALQAFGGRERIIVATKVGLEWNEGKVFRNSSPARLKKELEDSLRRLHTDYIDDLRNRDPKFQKPLFLEYLKAIEALNAFARDNYQKSVLALAVRWVLDKGHTVALWGARHPNQLEDIDEVMGWKLDENALKEIDNI